jgi:hypothetical protein
LNDTPSLSQVWNPICIQIWGFNIFEFSMKKVTQYLNTLYKYKITSMQSYSSNYQVCSPISLKFLIVILLN